MDGKSVLLRERHKSLYFIDGNVALQAPLPGEHALLFRVHQSVLSSHSPVFSGMFHVCGTPGSISETEGDGDQADHFYDGVPLVHIPDDGNHLELLLKVLYYQSDLPLAPRSPFYPGLVTPVLNLSRKYGITRIFAQIKGHLESDWPQTLDDWDNLEREIERTAKGKSVGRIDDHFPEPAAAIQLARQFEIPSILPAAFYHLSRISILDDWDQAHLDPSTQNCTKRTARWKLLSSQDFRCLLLARAEFAEMVRGWTDLPDGHGSRVRIGREDGYCMTAESLWKGIRIECLQSTDPLAVLGKPSPSDGYCKTCVDGLRDKMQALRGKIWERVGELCRLKDI